MTDVLVLQEAPEGFNPKVEVAACFVVVRDLVLFLKRQPHRAEGNTWGIAGGKCEKGETALEAVVREVKEETTIEVDASLMKSFGKVYIRYPHVDFIYHMFEYTFSELPNVVIMMEEHSEYVWVTLEGALKMTLIPGEAECIHLCYDGSTMLQA